MVAIKRDSGQPCGCDPAANHVCESHAKVFDRSKTEIEGAFTGGDTLPMTVVVTGPDADGEFGILAAGGEWSYLPRFVAQDLVDELQRRLNQRA
jgi:hypothetical protein